MLFNTRHFAIIASISIITNALPLDTKPRAIAARQKNYSVINVDGGATEAPATTVIKSTKTVEIVNPGPTVTQEVTTTVLDAAPTPAPVKSTSKCTSSVTSTSTSKSTSAPTTTSIISKPVETPKPVFITVTVPKDDGPTEYYDDGMWHTKYRIKTFAAAVATLVPSPSLSIISSSTTLPVLETPTVANNQTQGRK